MTRKKDRPTFTIGEVVTLKSGGPKMTVATVHDENWVICYWFIGSRFEDGAFEAAVLKADGDDFDLL